MLPPKLRRLLPRPFRRGEGWREGFLSVVYSAVLAVNTLNNAKRGKQICQDGPSPGR